MDAKDATQDCEDDDDDDPENRYLETCLGEGDGYWEPVLSWTRFWTNR